MKYLTIEPPFLLQKFVRSFWILEHEVDNGDPYIHRTLADGCAELIFHYKGRFSEILADGKCELSFRSGVHGQSQKFRRFFINQDFGIFGVYLYPFAAASLLSMPASEVSDQMPDIETILGDDGRILEEKMMLAANHQQRTQIISEFLIGRLIKKNRLAPGVFSAINQVIHSNGLTTVSDLAAKACLSTRQFERKFKEFSGFSPKLLSRISRFQHALQYYADKDKSLTEIAYECGYYDQSHFIHDFKEFSGQHPRFYFSGIGEGTEYRDA